MAINSRTKGSENERVVAKSLTKWSGYQFNRVPASGGLRWQQDNNVTGDIVPPFELHFPISVECKKVEASWEIDKLLLKNSEVWDWWKQACRDASRFMVGDRYKEPWLVFTKNRRKYYIMITKKHYMELPQLKDIPYIHAKVYPYDTYVFDFEQFLDIIKLDDIMSL